MRREIHMLTFPLPGLAGPMAQMAEGAGWDGIYFADTQNLAADVYVSLGIAAASTERMVLATGVTNPVTRHPAVTASAISAVQVASGGRAVLGIGRGDSALGFLGQKPARVRPFETYVSQVRAFLHGETADLGDATSRNEWIAGTGQPPVPIDIAATGPKVIAVAARQADRVTFGVGADPARLRDAIALVRSEREAAGLDPTSISVGAYVNAVAHPDADTARQIARGGTASFAHFSGMPGSPRQASSDGSVFEALGKNYDMAGHATASASHAAALPDAFIDRFAVAGPSEHCVSRLSELFEAGVERLVLVPGSRDADLNEVMASMNRLATEVIPKLR
ncbi:MAG: LLM class flavin-dependent oxidoreductase [Candidatus Binatia bacterium]|nr:LLM class flavin-dependent oxidoreductase [Candidatus Binatia bacterium]